MFTKKNQVKNASLLPGLFFFLLTSCSREKADPPVDTSSPAYHIAQAEHLVIPDAIQLPANLPNGNSTVATFFADGFQKYRAQEIFNSNPVAYQWVFVSPLADLYDAANRKVGSHSAGPSWQLSITDSLYGQAFDPARTAASSDTNSIDWLLLMPRTGKTPTGFFANVSYVQRLDTRGGKAPLIPPANASETANVHYTAVYRFSKINP